MTGTKSYAARLISTRVCAAALIAFMLSGCAGSDVEINAPILEAAGINLLGKKKEDPDLPDRPGIVIPPTKTLPEPGPRQVAAVPNEAWPQDSDQAKKAAELEAERKAYEYCRQGDWSGRGGIDEFNKSTGAAQRCRARYMEEMIKRNKEMEQARAAKELEELRKQKAERDAAAARAR